MKGFRRDSTHCLLGLLSDFQALSSFHARLPSLEKKFSEVWTIMTF